MPATAEALFILLVFVMPGFIAVRTRQMLVPSVERTDPLQLALQSITVSLLFLPLWVCVSPQLLRFRREVMKAASTGDMQFDSTLWAGPTIVFVFCLVVPAGLGVVWAVAAWNDWYVRVASRLYGRLGIPVPLRGVGDSVWDRLWLNRQEKPWLTVYMKDERVYIGQGIEFSLSPQAKELLLGSDTRMLDKDRTFVRSLADASGEGVWIPITEVSSIDVHR